MKQLLPPSQSVQKGRAGAAPAAGRLPIMLYGPRAPPAGSSCRAGVFPSHGSASSRRGRTRGQRHGPPAFWTGRLRPGLQDGSRAQLVAHIGDLKMTSSARGAVWHPPAKRFHSYFHIHLFYFPGFNRIFLAFKKNQKENQL